MKKKYCLPTMGLVHLTQSSLVVPSLLQMTRHSFVQMRQYHCVCIFCSCPSSAVQEADIKVRVVLGALVKLSGYLGQSEGDKTMRKETHGVRQSLQSGGALQSSCTTARPALNITEKILKKTVRTKQPQSTALPGNKCSPLGCLQTTPLNSREDILIVGSYLL